MINVPIGSFELSENDLFDVTNQVSVTDIEVAKLVARQALDLWWEALSIDVSDVGMLPIESAYNANAFNSALHLDTDAIVIDNKDATVVIPKQSVREKLREFNQDSKAYLDAWDKTLAVIESATTIAEILAVKPNSPDVEQVNAAHEERERKRGHRK